MVLRLPYQIKKIADTNPRIPPPVFDHSWFYYLSEVSGWVYHLDDFPFQPLSTQNTEIQPLNSVFLFSSVSDDSTDTICQEASQKAVAVHLWLKGKISSAAGSAHSWLPCAQHQEAPGGAGHLPPGWCCHSHIWFSFTVWHTHQSGECPLSSHSDYLHRASFVCCVLTMALCDLHSHSFFNLLKS